MEEKKQASFATESAYGKESLILTGNKTQNAIIKRYNTLGEEIETINLVMQQGETFQK